MSMLTHPAPDVTHFRKAYVLAEPGRSEGASVRYGLKGHCTACWKEVRSSTMAVRLADRTTQLHTRCAIREGHLVEVPAALTD